MELLLYTSGQRPDHRCATTCEGCRQNLINILGHIAALPLPESIHGKLDVSNGTQYAAHLANPRLILAGDIDEAPKRILGGLGLLDKNFVNLEVPYAKLIFRRDQLPKEMMKPLPESLRWGRLSTSAHYELVRKRTEIPRQNATLARLPSVGIFPSGDDRDKESKPIAWAFLNVEGGLGTLHVEPEWRGKGLAKMIAVQIVGRSMGDEGYGHADVSVDNKASLAVCKSIGGVAESVVYFLRVDLDAAEKLMGQSG